MENQKMQIRKIVISCFLVMCAWMTIVAAAQAANQSNPVALLQYIANNMIAGLKSHQATLQSKPQIVYQLADEYVVPYADLTEMSKRVLPPQTWNSATPAQRAQFQHQFTRTLMRTYASALTSYKDQTITFYPVRGDYQSMSTVEVDSQIESPENDPVHVTYRLVHEGSSWRLYDMSVEGVSMLESFRSQFADILSSGSMDELLRRMSAHNNR